MEFHTFIQLIFAVLFIGSMMILSFAMFRIPIKDNDKQIAIIAVVVGAINFYTKFIIQTPYALILQMVVCVILLMILRNYPIFYSFIICFTGLFGVALIDALFTIPAIQLGLSTIDLMSTKTAHFVVMHLIVTTVTLLIAYLLVRRSWGFSFVKRRFSGKYSLKTNNFIWAGLLATVFVILQLSSLSFEKYSLHVYIIIFVFIGLITSVIYAYFQNKKVLKDRRGGGDK